MPNLSRREILSTSFATVGVGASSAALGQEIAAPAHGWAAAFRREHQAGITTASQDRLLFASFDG